MRRHTLFNRHTFCDGIGAAGLLRVPPLCRGSKGWESRNAWRAFEPIAVGLRQFAPVRCNEVTCARTFGVRHCQSAGPMGISNGWGCRWRGRLRRKLFATMHTLARPFERSAVCTIGNYAGNGVGDLPVSCRMSNVYVIPTLGVGAPVDCEQNAYNQQRQPNGRRISTPDNTYSLYNFCRHGTACPNGNSVCKL